MDEHDDFGEDGPDYWEAFSRVPHLVAAGVGGSRSHGLVHPDSDYDLWAVYMEPAVEFLGLKPPKESRDFKLPWCDVATHELGKFLRLAVKGDPTVVERLFSDMWLPQHTTPTGESLRELRDVFVTNRLLKRYAGYIRGQSQKVAEKSPSDRVWWRAAKHTLRLSTCAIDLCTTRRVHVRLDPPMAATILEIITGDEKDAPEVRRVVAEWARLAEARITWALEERPQWWPDPDEAAVNAWLVSNRVSGWLAP